MTERSGPQERGSHETDGTGLGEPSSLTFLTQEEIERVLEVSEEDAASAVVGIVLDRADRQVRSWYHNVRRDLRRERGLRAGFEERLVAWPWGGAFDGLEALWLWTVRAARRYEGRQRRDARQTNDLRFEALSLLHRRALLVTSEVTALLRAGFASGALARWRTLHELATVAMFVGDHDQDLAERYLLHENILVARAMEISLGPTHQSQTADWGPGEVEEIRATRKELLRRYGKAYDRDYGWAAVALKDNRPDLGKVARATELDHWHPFLKMADHPVHAGARALYWDIGSPQEWGSAPIGATNIGLGEAGRLACLSLHITSVAFLLCRLDLRTMVDLGALAAAAEAAHDTFIHASEDHEEGMEFQREGQRRRLERRRAARSSR